MNDMRPTHAVNTEHNMLECLDAHRGRIIHDRGHLDGASIYRVRWRAATAIVCLLLGVSAMSACKSAGGTPAEPVPSSADEQDDASAARAKSQRTEDVLFDAIIEESRDRGYELKTISPKFHTVVTDYEQVSTRLRKRRIMKIIILPRGGALNVKVSYERDAGIEGAPDWQVLEDAQTHTRAAQEEMELARAIEQRLHTMKRQRARQR